jgi:hypothetical protein
MADRVFDIHPDAATVVIAGVTVQHGDVTASTRAMPEPHERQEGGGILNRGADLTLDNVEITQNRAYRGGGLFIDQGSVTTFKEGEITANSAGGYGGGVYVGNDDTEWGTPVALFTMESGEISGNAAPWGAGMYLYHLGEARLKAGQIVKNCVSNSGGGIHIRGFRANLVQEANSTIGYSCYSHKDGVSLANEYATATLMGQIVGNEGNGVTVSEGRMYLKGAQIMHNARGLVNKGGTLNVENSTISGNGTGLLNSDGTSRLMFATVANNNREGAGLGIHVDSGQVTMENSIVADHTAGNCEGIVDSRGHNLDSGDTCGLNGSGDLINTDPLLGQLQRDGFFVPRGVVPMLGYTFVHPLEQGSPAINAGACVQGITTDQRGAARPQEEVCDIGAYEYVPPWPGSIIPVPRPRP